MLGLHYGSAWKGREGAAKRHKDIPGPMPANSMSDSRLKDVIAYLRELQK